jgi:hypothetical protein
MRKSTTKAILSISLLLLGAKLALAQEVPRYPIKLDMIDSTRNEPLNGCEVGITCKFPNGEIIYENTNGTINDQYETPAYPVGSEAEIIVTKLGYRRQQFRHVLSLDPFANRITVKMATAKPDTVGLVIEGDLYFWQDGIRHAAANEIMRFYTQKGIREQTTDGHGHYRIEFVDQDLTGKDSLKFRAAQASDLFEQQDRIVMTKIHYKVFDFQLEPKTELVTLEIGVMDSTIGAPLENAHVRIYQASNLIAEGKTTDHGYYKTDSRFIKMRGDIDIQVSKEGFGGAHRTIPISKAYTKFALQTTFVKLSGAVKLSKKERYKLHVKLDTATYKTIEADQEGNWQIQIPRERLTNVITITVIAEGEGTIGEQSMPISEVLRENQVSFLEIDPKSKTGKWKNQINFGFGVGVDPMYLPTLKGGTTLGDSWGFLHKSIEMTFGARRIPNFLFGVGYNGMQLQFQHHMRVFEDSVVVLPAESIPVSYISFNCKYLIGPRSIPQVKLLIGFAASTKHERVLGGLRLQIGKHSLLELTAQYLNCWKTVMKYEFNYFGPPTPNPKENYLIQRPILNATLIKKISWE